MNAIVIEEFGGPDVLALREVPDPTLGPSDVLVDVEFASVTFVETQIRRGRPPHVSMLPQLPAIPGNGVGGTIVAVGQDVGVELVGRRVMSGMGGTGGYAEFAAVPQGGLIEIPDQIAMREAVALLADGRTAVALIDRAEIRTGETVLVEAAAGGVGSLLVQLANNAGAVVVAAAGGPRKLELARSLGAELVVDYTRASWAREVGLSAGGVDVVFDGVGGRIGREAFGLLRQGGRLCTYGMASGSFARISEEELVDRGVTQVRGAAPSPREMTSMTARALASAASGKIRPVIGQLLPLRDAADAHRAIEARATVGKTLLMP